MATLVPTATVHAPHGMVCTVDVLASNAGVSMLRAGGSAADAAIAANAVLAVTSQHLCGMGGDLFALVSVPGAPPVCLDAAGRAGSGADAERLRGEGHTRMPFRGDLSSTPVPGCVDGWLALHERFGRLPLADVLAPAVELAEGGFPASPTLALAVLLVADIDGNDDFMAPGPLRPGTLVRRPGVARALRAIAADGRAGFYGGEFGEGLLEVGGAEFTPDDLVEPLAHWVDPLGLDVWGRRLWTVPPPSQGFLTLASAWIAERLPVPADPADPRWAHLLVEAARHASWDRPAVLHEHADGGALLSAARLQPRVDAIDPDRAADLPDAHAEGGTTYLNAVDADRMGVSLIQSNAADFGAHVVERRTRIFLHNRGIGFSLQPGHPAEYGPRRRPPHTLAPALVTRPDGRLDMVIGTMGGDSQPHVLLQLLARLVAADDRHRDPARAIGAGRFVLRARQPRGFDAWDEGGRVTVSVEGQAPAAWDDGLTARGHDVDRVAAFDHGFGHAQIITVTDGGEVLAGAADPRPRTGSAAGY